MPIERVAGLTGNVAIKAPCLVATTEEILLYGEQTIDGVTVQAGDRVLVKDQSSASTNGIYVASTGAWSRSPDFNGPRDVVRGTLVYIADGDTLAQIMYRLEVTGSVAIGSTALVFEEVSPISADVAANEAAASAAEALASALEAAASVIAAAASATAAAASAVDAAESATLSAIGGNPVGAVAMMTGTTVPFGYLQMNGQQVSRTVYFELWNYWGQPNTGDGSTSFTIPDARGISPRFLDSSRGIDVGRVIMSEQTEMVGSHTHAYTDSTASTGNSFGQAGEGFGQYVTTGAQSLTTSANSGTENRVRNIAFMACVKALGPGSIAIPGVANQFLSTLTQSAGAQALATGPGSATLPTITQTARATVV